MTEQQEEQKWRAMFCGLMVLLGTYMASAVFIVLHYSHILGCVMIAAPGLTWIISTWIRDKRGDFG
jgi:putative Mn2+ efflux pump MntP